MVKTGNRRDSLQRFTIKSFTKNIFSRKINLEKADKNQSTILFEIVDLKKF